MVLISLMIPHTVQQSATLRHELLKFRDDNDGVLVVVVIYCERTLATEIMLNRCNQTGRVYWINMRQVKRIEMNNFTMPTGK